MQNLSKQNTMIPSLCNYDKLMLWDIHQKNKNICSQNCLWVKTPVGQMFSPAMKRSSKSVCLRNLRLIDSLEPEIEDDHLTRQHQFASVTTSPPED